MIFIGIDWAEKHLDVCVMEAAGTVVVRARVPNGIDGLRRIHEALEPLVNVPGDVVVGIETDRGLVVQGLLAADYTVYALNPLSVSRYRDRHAVSRAKSDSGDAKVLADLVRTDRHNHRQVAGDSELAEAIKVMARAHQTLIWDRVRQVNRVRNSLRDFYPAALVALGRDLAGADALAVLARAPTPDAGSHVSEAEIQAALEEGGRRRYVTARSAQIHRALNQPQLQPPPGLARAYGATILATVAVVAETNRQISQLERELEESFASHPDATILRSLPGLGVVLGARVLAEFGDDRSRYADARARRNYAGTAPITRASGTKIVVVSRLARNRRMADACALWAFSAVNSSPGARRYYDAHRKVGRSHYQALRALANRLVGILHGCLAHRSVYQEHVAWMPPDETAVA